MARAVPEAGNQSVTGLAMAAAGGLEFLAEGDNKKELQEKIFKFIDEQDAYWKAPEDQPTTFAGKAGKAIGSLPSYMNPLSAVAMIAGSGPSIVTGKQIGRAHV